MRLLAAEDGPDADRRTAVLVTILIVAFLGFAGVAAIAPDGLGHGERRRRAARRDEPDPAGHRAMPSSRSCSATARRPSTSSTVRAAVLSALTYAAAIAIGAAALRAMAIPRLLGPALLTLLFYLWDAVHAAPPTRRRDLRWWWQTALLGLLGIVVIAWNLLVRTP